MNCLYKQLSNLLTTQSALQHIPAVTTNRSYTNSHSKGTITGIDLGFSLAKDNSKTRLDKLGIEPQLYLSYSSNR